MSTETLEWSPSPTTRLGRTTMYATLAPLGGSLLLAVVLLLSIPLTGIGSGDAGTALFGVVLLFVGGVASILYLLAIHQYGEGNREWIEPWIPLEEFDGWWFAAASVVGAVAIVAVVLLNPLFVYAVLVAIPLAPMVNWWFLTSYELDLKRRRLTIRQTSPVIDEPTTVSFGAITSFRRVPGPVRGFQPFVCRRADGWPFVVPVPAAHVEAFEESLRRGRDVETEATRSSTGRGTRLVLYGFGLGWTVLGVVVALYLGLDGAVPWPIVGYLAFALAWIGPALVGYAALESVRARRDRRRARGE